MAKRRAEVVGDGIGKRFQFLVARFELRSALGELQIELANLVLALPALRHFDLKVVAGVTKVILDAAPDSAERGDDGRPSDEDEKVWQIPGGNVERVVRLEKEIVEEEQG